jgi:DNA-directed RNA polymerase specialized sigma24 family protein
VSALHKLEQQSRIPGAAPAAPAGTLRLVVSASDESLVTAAIAGDEGAFSCLATRHRLAAVQVAAAIVGDDRAEDVVQDALLLAFWALPSMRDRSKFLLGLTAITRELAVMLGVAESRRVWNHVSLDGSLEASPELACAPRVFDERGRPGA